MNGKRHLSTIKPIYVDKKNIINYMPNISHMNSSQYLLSVISILAASCSHQGVMKDVHVEPVSAEKVMAINVDTTFHCTFPEILNAYQIQIVRDSILVLQDHTSDNNSYYFKAYSTNSFEYLGEFIREGRGPGEMLRPHIARCCSSEEYLNMNINSAEKAYSVDVEKTLESENPDIVHSFDLPSGTIDWLPMPDFRQFVLQSENGCITFRYIGKNNEVSNTFELNKSIGKENFVTYLSSVMASNWKSGKVAQAMIFFPQINIFDTENGTLKSVAVDKAYSKWESVISTAIGKDTKQYYVGVATSQDYIFAAYKGIQLGQKLKSGHGTSIHVFDWDGNFKYDIEVREDIGCMTFDGRTKKLYCIENREGKIIRYDLAGLL